MIKANDVLIESGDNKYGSIDAVAVIKIGTTLKDSLIIAIGYLHAAQENMYDNKFTAATTDFGKALRIKLISAGNAYTGLAWNDMGYTYGQVSDLEKQTDCYFKALRIYEKLDDQGGMAMVYNNLSAMHQSLGQMDEAINYGKKAVALREKLGDLLGMGIDPYPAELFPVNNNANIHILPKAPGRALQYSEILLHEKKNPLAGKTPV